MKIATNQNQTSLAIQAASFLNQVLFENQEKDILLLFSGGSNFDVIKHLDPTNFSSKTTITVLDERFTNDAKHRNFDQLISLPNISSLYKNKTCNFINPIESMSDIEASASLFESQLREFYSQHPAALTIATFGIGKEGHTAGIFPMEKTQFDALFMSERYVQTPPFIPLIEGERGGARLTTTFTFMKQKIDYSVAYAVGIEKQQAIKKLISNSKPLNEFPAQILNELNNVTLFTDTIN